jgi:hypothetical protein
MNPKQRILTFDEPDSQSRSPSWLERMKARGDDVDSPTGEALNGPGTARRTLNVRNPIDHGDIDRAIETLRSQAIARARDDAKAGVPETDAPAMATSEVELRESCRSVFERWRTHERQSMEAQWVEQEKSLSDKMGRTTLLIDRIHRLTHELKRLKARLSVRRQEVKRELERAGGEGGRQLSTRT